MRRGSRQTYSRRSAGFTLLELSIAMAFVAVLIGGIVLTISTSLKVWERSRETADLNQEARSVIQVLSRDVRGSYLGLERRAGYFLAQTGQGGTGPTLEFTTENGSMARAAFLPEEAARLDQPATDYVAVRYELVAGGGVERPGLYRTSWVAPAAEWLEEAPAVGEAVGVELISERVTGLRLRYWDGGDWRDDWTTGAGNLRLPGAVGVQMTVLDDQGDEHIYETVISVPTH